MVGWPGGPVERWSGGAGIGRWVSKEQGPMLPLVLHKPDNASNKLQLSVSNRPPCSSLEQQLVKEV